MHDPRAWRLGGVAGNAGLFSTADDLTRFARMMLGAGELDGARVQVHKKGDEVRVYTRALNDVTAAVPEVVEITQRLDAERLVLDGEVIGSTTSIAMGHSVGRILAFAYIKPAANSPGQQLEVVIANAPRAAVVLGAAAYDPNSERPRGVASREAAA